MWFRFVCETTKAFTKVFISDGNSDQIAHTLRRIGRFSKKIWYVLIKCFKQIKSERLLYMCSPISELPYDISTKAFTKDFSEIKDWQFQV